MTRKVLTHMASWFLFSLFILFSQRGNYPDMSYTNYVILQLVIIAEMGIVFYINYLILIPKYILKKRRVLLYFLSVIALMTFGFVLSLGIRFSYSWMNSDDASLERIILSAVASLFPIAIFVIISAGIRLIAQYNEYQLNQVKLKEVAKRAELEALKAKVNPHFLYNAFNTLYALAETKSERISEAILQLSFIMRYLLNNSSNPQVSIFEELKFVRVYIDFQKLRVNDAENKIHAHIKDPDTDFLVSPTILLSFVENAFKHSNLLRPNHQITVDFEALDAGFIYQVSNDITKEKVNSSGVGNANLKKILELAYPEKYELEVWIKDDKHHAKLYLNLN